MLFCVVLVVLLLLYIILLKKKETVHPTTTYKKIKLNKNIQISCLISCVQATAACPRLIPTLPWQPTPACLASPLPLLATYLLVSADNLFFPSNFG